MKNITITTLAALLFGSSGLFAQNEATTTPSGFVTHSLKAGQFNLVGLTLHEPVTVSHSFSAVSGTTLTDEDTDFDATLTSGKTYVLEINSGTLAGAIQEVTVWGVGGSGVNTITTPDDLVADGLLAGDTYQLREVPTLERIFGTTDSVLKKGIVSTIADIVWIPTGSGGYSRYFLSTANVWKDASNNSVAPDVPVLYADGVIVERKGADVDLVLTGSVKIKSTSVAVASGFNPVSIVSPVGATLQNSGLSASLKPGVVSTIADIVWVPDGSGGYTRYFYHTTNVWRNAATNTAVAGDVDLPSSIFIERKGAAANVEITPPPSYSDL